MSELHEEISVHNHGKTSTEGDTGTTNWEEPIREHEENPEGEVDDGNRHLSESGEKVRDVLVGVFSEHTVTTACVFHYSSLGLRQIAAAEAASHSAV
mmetsp:Transcript_10260/g.12962  ORF Transcript_10260/g.12962 Transcript_10260/m.12962 type:complete len:97 (-) Transcript_10260:368-658(-)